MDVPGSDLLGMALSVINSQPVMYYQNTGRTLNTSGRMLPQFAEGVEVETCSVQSVQRSRYALYGLDVQKNYVTWFVEQEVLDVDRNISGDRISYNNRLFQCVSNADWFSQDGWVAVICVDIGSATNAPYNNVPAT